MTEVRVLCIPLEFNDGGGRQVWTATPRTRNKKNNLIFRSATLDFLVTRKKNFCFGTAISYLARVGLFCVAMMFSERFLI